MGLLSDVRWLMVWLTVVATFDMYLGFRFICTLVVVRVKIGRKFVLWDRRHRNRLLEPVSSGGEADANVCLLAYNRFISQTALFKSDFIGSCGCVCVGE